MNRLLQTAVALVALTFVLPLNALGPEMLIHEESGIEYPALGDVYPLKVHKGYPTTFASLISDAYGFEFPLHWEVDFRDYNTWFNARVDRHLYIELQMRQTDAFGQWSEWKNIESEFVAPSGLGNGNAHFPIKLGIPQMITGDRVEVRHRINNTLVDSEWWQVTRPQFRNAQWAQFRSEWKTYEIEVVSDGYERWIDPYDRKELTFAFFEDWTALAHTEMEWERPDYWKLPHGDGTPYGAVYPDPAPGYPHLEGPSEQWRDAMLQKINFYRRYAGVAPTFRSDPKFEGWAQAAALDMHLDYHRTHHRFLNDPERHEYVPSDHPKRKYYPLRGEEVRWGALGNLSWEGERTAHKEGGIDYFRPYQQENGFAWHMHHAIIWDFTGPVRSFMDDMGVNNARSGHRHHLLDPLVTEWATGSTLATYVVPETNPNVAAWQDRTYSESHVIRATAGSRENGIFKQISEGDILTRGNGVLYPAPGYVPVQMMSPRVSGFGIRIEHPDMPPVGEEGARAGDWKHHHIRIEPLFTQGTGIPYINEDEVLRARVWHNGREMDAPLRFARLDLTDNLLYEFSIDLAFEWNLDLEFTNPVTLDLWERNVQDYRILAGTDPRWPRHQYWFSDGTYWEANTDKEAEAIWRYRDDNPHLQFGGGNYYNGWPNMRTGMGLGDFPYFHPNEPAAMYPFPRTEDGTDLIEVELTFHPTQEQRELYGYPEKVVILEYAFRVYKPHIAFDDDVRKVGNSVYSKRMGWYDITHYPWIWMYESQTWMFVESQADQKLSRWYYDLNAGWVYLRNRLQDNVEPNYPWVYNADHGWLMYLEGTSQPRWYYAFDAAKWINFEEE